MCIFCIGTNDFMLKDKSLLEYTVPYISEKTLVLPITLSVVVKMKKNFKEEESIRILKILGLIIK